MKRISMNFFQRKDEDHKKEKEITQLDTGMKTHQATITEVQNTEMNKEEVAMIMMIYTMIEGSHQQ